MNNLHPVLTAFPAELVYIPNRRGHLSAEADYTFVLRSVYKAEIDCTCEGSLLNVTIV